jgi:transcriptional regulatory protein LEU3
MDPHSLPPHSMGTHSAPMSFDGGWDGEAYMFPPMLDQFPDYDWAASFDFSQDPSQMPQMQQMQQPVDMGPMNAGPTGYQYR